MFRLPSPRRYGLIAALVIASLTALHVEDAVAAPRTLERSLDRPTRNGLFRVKVASAVNPIPMNAMHRWTVYVAGRDGRPVQGATIAVDGGMPEHGHGLPTAPRAVPGTSPGQYVVQGMKFSMDGWWELKLTVSAAGRSDAVTFNVVL